MKGTWEEGGRDGGAVRGVWGGGGGDPAPEIRSSG